MKRTVIFAPDYEVQLAKHQAQAATGRFKSQESVDLSRLLQQQQHTRGLPSPMHRFMLRLRVAFKATNLLDKCLSYTRDTVLLGVHRCYFCKQ